MSQEEREDLRKDADAFRRLIKWFGGSLLAGMVMGVTAAIVDHFALLELQRSVQAMSARFDRLEQLTIPRVDRMWYQGGWEGSQPAIPRNGGGGGPAPNQKTAQAVIR